MGTLVNVPLASAHGRYTAAALSCIQWKAYHEFHVPHVIVEYLQLQQFTITYEFNTLLLFVSKFRHLTFGIFNIFFKRKYYHY